MGKFVWFAFLIVLIAGCGSEPQPAARPGPTASKKAAPQRDAAAKEQPSAEEAEEEEVYVYNPTDKRDPFTSLMTIRKPVVSESQEPLTPLQNFDVDQFILTGVIIGFGEPRAMVVAPDNKSYVLKKGTLIGKNNGRVINVTQDAVLVEELYFDYSGEVRKNIRSIELPKKEGVQ